MTDTNQPAPTQVGKLLDLASVAARLGVSVKTVRRMVDRGDLPFHRFGRLLRVSDADIAEYIASHRRSAQ